MRNHLQILINRVTAHQAQLGAPLVTDATALLTGWNAVYTVSESEGDDSGGQARRERRVATGVVQESADAGAELCAAVRATGPIHAAESARRPSATAAAHAAGAVSIATLRRMERKFRVPRFVLVLDLLS